MVDEDEDKVAEFVGVVFSAPLDPAVVMEKVVITNIQTPIADTPTIIGGDQ